MKSIDELAMDRMADKAIAWIERANKLTPNNHLRAIVPTREDLIEEVYHMAAMDLEAQDASE